MAIAFRVMDLRTDLIDEVPLIVEGAVSPEDAARQVLGIDVVRSGARKDLVAKVYWQLIGQPTNMVRLYLKAPKDE